MKSITESNTTDNLSVLPNEVLSTLFEIGQAWHNEQIFETETTATPFELVVSHISRRTRQTALSTPKLWSTIEISPTSNYERVAEYVKRSAQVPLDIRIFAKPLSSPDDERSVPDALVDLVLLHSLRWVSLSVAEGNSVVRRICDHPAPDLRYLSLSVDHIEGDDINTVKTNLKIFESDHDRLDFIRLRGFALLLYRPQFNAVVTLHLEETKQIPLTYDSFRHILFSCPVLANLSLYGDIISWSTTNIPENDIRLPKLRTLRICGVSGEVYSGLLRGIQAPNLESLTLKGLQEHDLDQLLITMDASKFTNLQCLKVCDFGGSVRMYEDITRVFKNVTCFCTLHSPLSDSNLVDLLLDNSMDAHSPLWPSLENMSFPSYSDEEEGEILDELIETRSRDGCPMRRISFGMNDDDEKEKVGREKGGVKIVYSSKKEGWPSNSFMLQPDDLFFQD